MRTHDPRLFRGSMVVALACGLAGLASAAPAEPPPTPLTAARATVLHVPVAVAESGTPIVLVAVIDGAWAEPTLVARYRPMGAGAWQEAAFERSSAGGWYATIPAEVLVPPGAEYYIVGRGDGGETAHFASEAAPQPIRVEPSVVDRLAELDRRRTGGRTETISLDVDAHDFGNRYGNGDWFLRSEARWTHRISDRFWSIGFGFGLIQGRTPDRDGADAEDAVTAARYGVAEVRLRPLASLFVDGRMMLGVSHEDFIEGIAAAITFGKPWRSNVSVGAESLEDLGPTAYVRLQWDTAPPLLMGASIVRTDLPGAVLDADGLYLRYDVSYRLSPALGVRAAVSYGARDGTPHVGGGLGLSTDFCAMPGGATARRGSRAAGRPRRR
ncbi:MAG TPA: hypothetical protein VHE35_33340 [Kofleriaceae bacterium]|nr:hypothetical protein [Kofleriaceae bacterium]